MKMFLTLTSLGLLCAPRLYGQSSVEAGATGPTAEAVSAFGAALPSQDALSTFIDSPIEPSSPMKSLDALANQVNIAQTEPFETDFRSRFLGPRDAAAKTAPSAAPAGVQALLSPKTPQEKVAAAIKLMAMAGFSDHLPGLDERHKKQLEKATGLALVAAEINASNPESVQEFKRRFKEIGASRLRLAERTKQITMMAQRLQRGLEADTPRTNNPAVVAGAVPDWGGFNYLGLAGLPAEVADIALAEHAATKNALDRLYPVLMASPELAHSLANHVLLRAAQKRYQESQEDYEGLTHAVENGRAHEAGYKFLVQRRDLDRKKQEIAAHKKDIEALGTGDAGATQRISEAIGRKIKFLLAVSEPEVAVELRFILKEVPARLGKSLSEPQAAVIQPLVALLDDEIDYRSRKYSIYGMDFISEIEGILENNLFPPGAGASEQTALAVAAAAHAPAPEAGTAAEAERIDSRLAAFREIIVPHFPHLLSALLKVATSERDEVPSDEASVSFVPGRVIRQTYSEITIFIKHAIYLAHKRAIGKMLPVLKDGLKKKGLTDQQRTAIQDVIVLLEEKLAP